MKRYVLTLFLIFLVASTTLAQTAPAADPPSSREDITKLFDVMQIRKQMKLVMEQVTQQMRAVTHEQMKKYSPTITDLQMAKIDALSEGAMRSMSTDDILDDMIPVYQKHLTKADVDAMIGFYSTPTGQKILQEMPAMTAEGMQAIQPRLRKQMDEMTQKVEQMLKEELQEQHTAPRPATKKN